MSSPIAQLEIPSGAPGLAATRDLVADTLHNWGLSDPFWVVSVCAVAAELVSNAVRHAGGCSSLGLRRDGDSVIIYVEDISPGRPHRREGGFGMAIIGAFTQSWGAEHIEGGKLIWARMPACPHVATSEHQQ